MDLRVERIEKVYGRGVAAKRVLEPTSLTVAAKEFVSIVGPSGCGKSTLLMMVAGLLPHSGGQIMLADTTVSGPPMGVSVVFQDYSRSLFPWMTVGRNLSMAATAYKIAKPELKNRVNDALESVGLPGKADMYPWQMSGGMQQRVAIARALVVEPTVMLMDEPFAAVDAQTRADLEDLVLQVRADYQVTVVFVTHDIDEAVYMADQVVVMGGEPGRIVANIDVDLPRPRDQVQTKLDHRFSELRSEVFQLVMRRDGQPDSN